MSVFHSGLRVGARVGGSLSFNLPVLSPTSHLGQGHGYAVPDVAVRVAATSTCFGCVHIGVLVLSG